MLSWKVWSLNKSEGVPYFISLLPKYLVWIDSYSYSSQGFMYIVTITTNVSKIVISSIPGFYGANEY